MHRDEFRADGWRSIDERNLPPPDETVEFARETNVFSQPPWFGRWDELDPQFNVAGLWWRLP